MGHDFVLSGERALADERTGVLAIQSRATWSIPSDYNMALRALS